MKVIEGGKKHVEPWKPCKYLGEGTWLPCLIQAKDEQTGIVSTYPILAFCPDGGPPEHYNGKRFQFVMQCTCPAGSPQPPNVPTSFPPTRA